MNKQTVIYGCMVFFMLVAANAPERRDHVNVPYPDGWPAPVYDFGKKPLTESGIELGRKLFYDPILSKDNTISCSSCHLSYTAFTHVDHALSHGIGDSIGTRNSPALMNLAWSKSFMWDGAVNHLEVQALAPISHPGEMGEDISSVIHKLQQSHDYTRLFQRTFGDSQITGERMLKALAQFQLTFVSANSKYDKVTRQEPGEQFTEQEQRGYEIFKSNCATCHSEPLFTSGAFANNGLPVDTTLMDMGRMNISKSPGDSLKFKIPTLRNIEFSYPYMHDGRFKTLFQVLNHYTHGIADSKTLAGELRSGIHLSHEDKVDVVAFLLTLTDKEFLFNPDLAFPRK